MTEGNRISVLINTKNEASRIRHAINSVKSWAGEIVVVDMHSDDGTGTIAKEMGARVIDHPDIGFVEPARRRAVEEARLPWVLVLDADELVPPSLAESLIDISHRDDCDVVLLSCLNFFFGSPLRHTGWGPKTDRHIRFFRPGFVQFGERIHEPPRPVEGARLYTLEPAAGQYLLHHNYVDVSHFLEKLDRYTTIEANHMVEARLAISSRRAALGAAREFWWRFVRHGGYRDGFRGLSLSWLMATYRLVAWAKANQLKTVGDRSRILEIYNEHAEAVINEYGADTEHRSHG